MSEPISESEFDPVAYAKEVGLMSDTMTVWLEPKGWANPNKVPVRAKWYCARPKDAIGYVCTPYRPCGSDCHWAVSDE